MKKHTLLVTIFACLCSQTSIADWNSNQNQSSFTSSDLAQQQTYSVTRGNFQNHQALAYTRNDHREVNDVFNRNQSYEGLTFTSTSTTSRSNRLHFLSQISRDEQNFGGVISQGNWLFGLSAGKGQNFIKSSQIFTGIDPYFIHGGSATKFNYYGANAGYNFINNSLLYFGSSKIQADSLDDRQANYAGFHSRKHSATLMNFTRDGSTIGKGLELSTSIYNYQLGYRQISRNNGAHSKTISVELPFTKIKSGMLGFAVESVNNPLSNDQDDLKFMFTLSGQWGKADSVFNAGEETQTDQGADTGINKMAVIGAGVVAGAVILSSGSSSKDSNESINASNQEEAAFRVLNQINPVSVRESREFGGYVYRNPNGSYGYTNPKRGQYKSINLGDVRIPNGTRRTASYHTHGNDDPQYVNEEFSPTDIRSNRLSGIDGYLGTPAGKMKFFDLETNTIVTVRNIAR